VDELHDLIDECCDVDQAEILEIGPGGVYWAGAVDFVVLIRRRSWKAPPQLPGGASISDTWLDDFFEENAERWTQINVAYAADN
jgi:hypothetical protein